MGRAWERGYPGIKTRRLLIRLLFLKERTWLWNFSPPLLSFLPPNFPPLPSFLSSPTPLSSLTAADIKGSDDDLTPLHFSARYTPRIVDEAEEQLESVGGNAQEVTIFSSSKRAVQFLVHNCHVDVNPKAQYGISPLHLACQRSNYPAVKALLESPNIDVSVADDNQDTPLHEACLSGDQRIVELLLQKIKQEGANLLLQNDEKKTPLHVACMEGHTEIVKLILQYGFQQRRELVTAQDNEFSTPLHLACENGNEEIVRILLLNGADIHAAKDEEISPLHLAARHGFIKVATTLLDSGLDIINILNTEQQTPLHFAAQFNQCDMVTFLLEKWVHGLGEEGGRRGERKGGGFAE